MVGLRFQAGLELAVVDAFEEVTILGIEVAE